MRRSPLSIALAITLATLVSPMASVAAWFTTPLESVKPVGNATDSDSQTECASDGSGGVVLAVTRFEGANMRILAQRLTAQGDPAPGWPTAGLTVCNAASLRYLAGVVSDGAGGAYIAWRDLRKGLFDADIYVQRVSATGAISPGWPAAGLVVEASTKDADELKVQSDGLGGVYLAYSYAYSAADHDLYVHRVGPAGTVLWGRNYSPTTSQGDPALLSDAGGVTVSWDESPGTGGADLMIARWSTSGAVLWAPTVLCNATGSQVTSALWPDGFGGTFATWIDLRNGTSDTYGTHLDAAGHATAGWPANGHALLIDAGGSRLSPDGLGGFFILWSDAGSLYLGRCDESGTQVPGWGPVLVTQAGAQPALETLLPDGEGGVIAVWRAGTVEHLYAARFLPSGVRASGFTFNGNLVQARSTSAVSATSDGRNGALLVWVDGHDGFLSARAARMDRFGALGDVTPKLTGVRDVLADQGGQVRLDWNACLKDAAPEFPIAQYWVWRQVPAALAAQAVSHGARWLDDAITARLVPGDRGAATAGRDAASGAGGPPAPRTAADAGLPRLFLPPASVAAPWAWEFLALLPATGMSAYSFVAPTTTDSMPGSNPETRFMVQARLAFSSGYWDSPPDSGYSVDNLAPPVPSPFLGTWLNGETALDWGASASTDFSHYVLHRGPNPGFVPGPGTLVTSTTLQHLVDPAPSPYVYKLAAVDAHGNVSAYATVIPRGTVGAPGPGLPAVLALAAPRPNPMRAGGRVAFSLPGPGHVRLSLFDVAGRRVDVLADEAFAAGEHALAWASGAPGHARIAAGMYALVLEAGGERRVQRVVVAE